MIGVTFILRLLDQQPEAIKLKTGCVRSNVMEAVNKTNGNIYRIQQDTNGKWFGYCDRTKEYTPAFLKLKGLIGLLELKGYEVVE